MIIGVTIIPVKDCSYQGEHPKSSQATDRRVAYPSTGRHSLQGANTQALCSGQAWALKEAVRVRNAKPRKPEEGLRSFGARSKTGLRFRA